MNSIRTHHWMAALFAALALHLSVFYANTIRSNPAPLASAKASGIGGFEINLGKAGAKPAPKPVPVEVERREAPVKPVTPKTAAKKIVKKKTVKKKPANKTKTVRKVAQPKPSVTAVAPTPAPPSPTPAPAEPPSAQAYVPAGNSGQGSASTSGGAPGIKKDYYSTISALLAKNKRYPRIARRRNQQGTVKISFRIAPDGTVTSKQIKSSSGYRVLDNEAIDLISRLSPFPPIPKELGSKALSIELPLEFTLRR